MSDETIEKTFQVASPSRLTLSNIRGSVTIQAGEPDRIEIKAIKHGNFDTGRYSVEITQDADGSVRAETRSNDILFGFLSYPPKVDYVARVPQGIQLEASCISSTLNVSGLEGTFRLKTISGEVELAQLLGPLKFSAVSGDISGSKLAGVLDLNTVSGRVRLTESNFPSADASTVSGDLTLQTPVSAGPYQFSSVSGSVRLIVPTDTRCNVELHSVSGNIRSSLPATATRIGHGVKVTQIQGGGTSVRLKSVSGGVSIEIEGVPSTAVPATEHTQSDFTPPIPPIPPIPSPTTGADVPLTTEEILQRIERGEMTVDEAIKLMKGE